MHRNGVGQHELVGLAPVVIHAAPVEIDGQRLVDGVEAADEADIAVEDVLIVIVLHLHHLVAQA